MAKRLIMPVARVIHFSKKEIMLTLQNISYHHPDRELLFNNINLSVNRGQKLALLGNNGTGKSTLLKIIAGEMPRDAMLSGQRLVVEQPYYIPQIFGQFNHLTIAQALRVDEKLKALKKIFDGNATAQDFIHLIDDWTIEERCAEALNHWQLTGIDLMQKTGSLSGGQKTKVFLAGIFIHQPELILLDEPSNHLDKEGRQRLYEFIRTYSGAMIVVSHDRTLLNLLDTTCELKRNGLSVYGGNYDFYVRQKQIEHDALNRNISHKAKELRKAVEKERMVVERLQKTDIRGKNKKEKSGVSKMMMNSLRNKAESSTSKVKSVQAERTGEITKELKDLRSPLPDTDRMKFDFDDSGLHHGKILFSAAKINHSYTGPKLWKENLDIQIRSGERIALNGPNGSGKTTLIKIILGEIFPETGTVHRAENNAVYIDQDYSLIENDLTVFEQAQKFNSALLQDHEVKTRLNRFLFTQPDWDKSCRALSGGERMRLMICCLNINNKSPDIIILDEPTNNLDIQNIEILTAAINQYHGTLIVVSHDTRFLEEIGTKRIIEL